MRRTVLLLLLLVAAHSRSDGAWEHRQVKRAQRDLRRVEEAEEVAAAERHRMRVAKAAEQSRKLGARQDLPVVLSAMGPVIDAACPQRQICQIFVSNFNVPLLSIYAKVTVTDGSIFPATSNTVNTTACSTFVQIPYVPVVFRQVWNSSSIIGEWYNEDNLASVTSPPLLLIHNIAMDGSGQQRMSGMYQVTIMSQVAPYEFELCCGFGCNATTTPGTTSTSTAAPTTQSTTAAATTTTTAATTVATTAATTTTATTPVATTQPPQGSISFSTAGPTAPAACPGLLYCSLMATNPGMSIISAFGNFFITDGALTPTTPNFAQTDCLSYAALPDMIGLNFTGLWNASRVLGAWDGQINGTSLPGSGQQELFRFAMSGSGFQTVSGSITVTTISQLSFQSAFCCGVGCANTTTATVPATPTTAPQTTAPAGPVNFVVMNQTSPSCPQLTLCSVFVNNSIVELVSAFGDFSLTNNATFFVPSTVNTNSADQCRTYVSLPNLGPEVLEFRGAWNASRIAGSWNGPFNMPSATPPPLVELIHFAIDGGSSGAPRGVSGLIVVTTISQVQYEARVCCGDCSPPPPPRCPVNVTVPYARNSCTNATSTATLDRLVNNTCLAPNVMFMNPPNVSAAPTVPPAAVVATLPVVAVSVSTNGFGPRDVRARRGDTVLFTWVNGTHTVTAGSCTTPATQLFHSGLFSAPHSFVVFADAPLAVNQVYSFHSRADCSHTGTLTIAA